MKYVKILAVIIISFVAVFTLPNLLASDTLVIENGLKTIESGKVDDTTATLIIALITAIVNLVIHLLGGKKNKNK